MAVLIGIFVFINTHPIRPQDFWWHITIGREILATGKIPGVDVYSYTAVGQPYPSYKMFWLMEIVLYEIFTLGGAALIIFFYSIIITLAYGVIFWICYDVSKNWRIAAAGLFFAAALGLNDWNVRPQGITFLLASLFLLAIYQFKKRRHWGWLVTIPICMLVWVNSHGTFVIGLALLGIWLAAEMWRALKKRLRDQKSWDFQGIIAPAGILIITAMACLANPGGLGIINYVKTLTGNSVVQNLVTEWAPPTFNTLIGTIFFAGLIFSAVALAVSVKQLDFYQAITFLIFGILGLRTLRGSVWFGLVMAPVLAEHISYAVERFQKANHKTQTAEGSRTINVIFVTVLLAMAMISLPWFKRSLPLPPAKAELLSNETPVTATQALLELQPPRQVFNAMSFGSYLIWAAYPHYQVFIDSRIELFPDKVWLDYLNISNANGDWRTLLNGYGVKTLMLSPVEQAGLVLAVHGDGGWDLVYEDQTAMIFVKK